MTSQGGNSIASPFLYRKGGTRMGLKERDMSGDLL